jgi:RsiW-degrading membrane proteinase PrsW (M82 family)
MITVNCKCGNIRQFDDTLAGQSTRCPNCGTVMKIGGTVVPQPPIAPKPRTTAVNPFAFSSPEPQRPPLSQLTPPAASTPAVPEKKVTLAELRARGPMTGSIPRTSAPATPMPAQTPRPSGPNTAALFCSPKKPKQGNVLYELRYWLLSLALLPLIISLFRPEDNVQERIQKTIQKLPKQVADKAKSEAPPDEDDEEAGSTDPNALFKLLPDGRIEGALLSHDSWGHWGMAFVSAAFFWGIIIGLFPRGNAESKDMLLAGIFTGTAGILLLLGVQWIAFNTGGWGFHGGGKLMIILLILKFIAFSYYCAMDPSNGFFLSFFGFTFGVGLCEEMCKGLALLYHFKSGKGTLDWRGACVWGLACGVGFGVSEGISYSSDSYNGIYGLDIYLIRFISCVALHAIWSAAVGISLYRHRDQLRATATFGSMMGVTIKAIIVPMVLHGAYDTLLKKDMPGAAVLVAIGGFGWLAYQIERAYAAKEEVASEPAIQL